MSFLDTSDKLKTVPWHIPSVAEANRVGGFVNHWSVDLLLSNSFSQFSMKSIVSHVMDFFYSMAVFLC